MLTKSRRTSGYPSAQESVRNTTTRPAEGDRPVPSESEIPFEQPSISTARETRREHSRRKARRSRLHGYAIVAVALVSYLVALAASNTTHVKVNWVFASSRLSLVWLVLFAALLGWMLGLVATATFHWRTRAPRRGGDTRDPR